MSAHRRPSARPDWPGVCRAVGLLGRVYSVDEVLKAAETLYWRRRPNPTPRCGSIFGYRAHRRAGHTACPPCRKAYAMCRAVWRRRAELGLNADGSPRQLREAA